MEIVRLEVDQGLYRSLSESVCRRHSTVEQECIRRLSQNGRRSYYLQALVAELRRGSTTAHWVVTARVTSSSQVVWRRNRLR